MIPAKKIDLLERKIQSDCLPCHGSGCPICRSKSARIKLYANANIPIDYWLLAFKDFQGDSNFKNSISEILSNIDLMYEKGTSLAFVGNFGTGKTYAACCFLKSALISGYSAKYLHMSDVINELMASHNNAEYLKNLIETDFVVLDEFDRRFVFPSEKTEQLFGQTLEFVLRSRFQNYMPTILCSNTIDIDQVLTEDFSRAFASLRSKYLKIYQVGGKDFRKHGSSN